MPGFTRVSGHRYKDRLTPRRQDEVDVNCPGISTSKLMLTQITDRIPPLPILLPILLTVWAGACTVLHGPAILAYIVLQAATSGIFALSMYRITRLHSRSPKKPTSKSVDGGGSPVAQNDKRPVTTS